MRSIVLVTVLLCVIDCGICARILAVLPFPGKSHHIFHNSIMKSLIDRGHQVVEYGPFPPKKAIANYTHVKVYTSYEESLKHWSYEDMQRDIFEKVSPLGLGLPIAWEFLNSICEETLKDKNIQKLLKSKEQFDLVLTTSTFGQESMLVFGHKFGVPTVTLQGFSNAITLNRDSGNALSIATMPDSMSFAFTDRMTFIQRLQNFVSVALTLFLYYNKHLPKQNDIVKKHYYQPNTPSVAQMVSNISLTLVNSHPNIQYAQPYTPNIVPIGGITITSERIQLPQDVQKFMDGGKEGVIYFSFGTAVPAHDLPKNIIQAFINSFKKLRQKVLWKIEIDSFPDLPKNVMLTKWVPQIGVLAHPNCVLFITHGGFYSQNEAIHAGVPTIGVPFFIDQPFNIQFNEHNGIGVKLDLTNINEDTVYSAITTVLNNPKYKENAMRMSRIYRDRPMSPADTAVFWVEYVLRHDGAHHLRSAATQLSWYQLALLDILAAILAATITVFITLYLILKKLFSLIFAKQKLNKSLKHKKTN